MKTIFLLNSQEEERDTIRFCQKNQIAYEFYNKVKVFGRFSQIEIKQRDNLPDVIAYLNQIRYRTTKSA
jgi:hypothetical protein